MVREIRFKAVAETNKDWSELKYTFVSGAWKWQMENGEIQRITIKISKLSLLLWSL